MENWSFDNENQSGVLVIDEDMTVNHISKWKERLVEAFRQAENVTVDLSSTEAVDVSGLQLLCACHRFCHAQGKTMILKVNENRRFVDFLGEVGFSREHICIPGEAEACLWSSVK